MNHRDMNEAETQVRGYYYYPSLSTNEQNILIIENLSGNENLVGISNNPSVHSQTNKNQSTLFGVINTLNPGVLYKK